MISGVIVKSREKLQLESSLKTITFSFLFKDKSFNLMVVVAVVVVVWTADEVAVVVMLVNKGLNIILLCSIHASIHSSLHPFLPPFIHFFLHSLLLHTLISLSISSYQHHFLLSPFLPASILPFIHFYPSPIPLSILLPQSIFLSHSSSSLSPSFLSPPFLPLYIWFVIGCFCFSEPITENTTLYITYQFGNDDESYTQEKDIIVPVDNITVPAQASNASFLVKANLPGSVIVGVNSTSEEFEKYVQSLFSL